MFDKNETMATLTNAVPLISESSAKQQVTIIYRQDAIPLISDRIAQQQATGQNKIQTSKDVRSYESTHNTCSQENLQILPKKLMNLAKANKERLTDNKKNKSSLVSYAHKRETIGSSCDSFRSHSFSK